MFSFVGFNLAERVLSVFGITNPGGIQGAKISFQYWDWASSWTSLRKGFAIEGSSELSSPPVWFLLTNTAPGSFLLSVKNSSVLAAGTRQNMDLFSELWSSLPFLPK